MAKTIFISDFSSKEISDGDGEDHHYHGDGRRGVVNR